MYFFNVFFFASVYFVSVQSAQHHNTEDDLDQFKIEPPLYLSEYTAFKKDHEENEYAHPAVPRGRVIRSVWKNEKTRWPNQFIAFEINPEMSSEEIEFIHRAIKHYRDLTCLEFIYKTDEDKDYIYFDNRQPGCFSEFVGRKGGRQIINLDKNYCATSGSAIRAIFQALGFHNESNRPDRDDYITIHWENILPALNNSFMKDKSEDVDTLGLPYDYQSIVHFSKNGGSKNGKPTISAKVPNQAVGSTGGLSKLDVRKINTLFKCGDSSSATSTLSSTNKLRTAFISGGAFNAAVNSKHADEMSVNSILTLLIWLYRMFF